MITTKNNFTAINKSALFFYGLMVLALILGFLLMRPFLGTIVFTLLLAAYFHPLYENLVKLFRGRKAIASFCTASFIILLIIIPVAVFISLAINQAISFGFNIVEQINTGSISIDDYINKINIFLDKLPLVNFQISPTQVLMKLVENSQAILSTTTDVLVFGSKTAVILFEQIAVFIFLLYGIFPFLRSLKDKIFLLSPLPNEVDRMILTRVYEMGKAVFLGIVVVGLVQGIIGGVGFIITGVPAVAFWMLMMIFLAIIPMIGVGFVLVPTILTLLAAGEIGNAIVMIVVFLIAINIDNYLRPLLVGKQTAINPVLMIIAILGGLKLFGIFGVFFGPMTLVFVLTLFEAYEKHYAIKEKQS